MMSWDKVGSWIKSNASSGVTLVGSLLTGNIPGAIAAGASLISGATGTDDPEKALESLQNNPEAMVKLKELYYKNEDSVRKHIETMHLAELEDNQKEHTEQQNTIREGDKATDEYVRRTRPMMARQSWYSTILYVIGMELFQMFDKGAGAEMELAMILIAPASAYIGFRTWDKNNKKKL